MRNNSLYLKDISESIEKIIAYTKGVNYEEFANNSMVFDAVIRNFEIIGEAAKNIPDEIKLNYPDIPWTDMIGMRNILIHGYFGIDYTIVWNTISLLPDLQNRIIKIQHIF
jgi:uncharacterized protein with HEPN domain